MHIIKASSPDQALALGLEYLSYEGKIEPSRNGDVLVAPEPVATQYSEPFSKVSLSPLRDANPFFHLMEVLWMLTGQQDSKFLNVYIKDFGSRFAEPNGYIHGAYGHRWRTAFGYDQLEANIEKLALSPDSRQAVLQMWDGTNEACEGMDDLLGVWKDRPCNTHIYFRRFPDANKIDMTVMCRSNDIVLGAYGANVVHFGFLLDYVAASLGVRAGTYVQFSNNYHAYHSELIRLGRRLGIADAERASIRTELARALAKELKASPRSFDNITPTFDQAPIRFTVYETWKDVLRINANEEPYASIKGRFAGNMTAAALAHRAYRKGEYDDALGYVNAITWPDWMEACKTWLNKRKRIAEKASPDLRTTA